jgi:hypothetical protein
MIAALIYATTSMLTKNAEGGSFYGLVDCGRLVMNLHELSLSAGYPWCEKDIQAPGIAKEAL